MAFVPAVYAGTEASGDGELMLARRTDWIEQGGIETGIGQRLIATDGPEEGILSVRDIRLD
jgi:type VI secretion system protein ImpE